MDVAIDKNRTLPVTVSGARRPFRQRAANAKLRSPLEKLLIERIVTNWLMTKYFDTALAKHSLKPNRQSLPFECEISAVACGEFTSTNLEAGICGVTEEPQKPGYGFQVRSAS